LFPPLQATAINGFNDPLYTKLRPGSSSVEFRGWNIGELRQRLPHGRYFATEFLDSLSNTCPIATLLT
jgi:hypothetical protein